MARYIKDIKKYISWVSKRYKKYIKSIKSMWVKYIKDMKKYLAKYITFKVGYRSQGHSEGSIFNSYYTEVLGRAPLLSLRHKKYISSICKRHENIYKLSIKKA